ncbi:MAG TPA: hypothetical protein VFV90_01000 [Usitatibacter sp.]|nr:hypothetical protein [Usitatibacter sp.]
MAHMRKTILAVLAGAVVLPAAASHYGRDYPRNYDHYDRYGNPLWVDRGYVAPRVEPRLVYPDYNDRYGDRDRYGRYSGYPRYETRSERDWRIERDLAQEGLLDTPNNPHPLSPNYSPG